MTNVYLVRHAQSTGNVEKRLTGRKNYSLTLEGKQQVKKLTDRLSNVRFDIVYSSPAIRAIETVKPLACINNLNINIENNLSEMYFGIYDGFKWEEVNKINKIIDINHKKTNEIMGIKNQETTEQVTNRMYSKIIDIVNANKNKTILMASHGVAIEAFLRKITKVPFIEKIEEYSQRNTSVNIIEYNEETETFYLKTLNDIEHLNYI